MIAPVRILHFYSYIPKCGWNAVTFTSCMRVYRDTFTRSLFFHRTTQKKYTKWGATRGLTKGSLMRLKSKRVSLWKDMIDDGKIWSSGNLVIFAKFGVPDFRVFGAQFHWKRGNGQKSQALRSWTAGFWAKFYRLGLQNYIFLFSGCFCIFPY